MTVWPCAVRAVRNGRLCTKILRSPGNLPVSGVSVLTKAMKRRRGDRLLPISPSTLRPEGKRESSARAEGAPVLTLLHIVKERVLESQVLLQMLIPC
jgi:hypothetical protein